MIQTKPNKLSEAYNIWCNYPFRFGEAFKPRHQMKMRWSLMLKPKEKTIWVWKFHRSLLMKDI